MTNALDLYSKVEDLLGVKEASPKLYAHYFLALNSIDFNSILDVGCGSGDFLYQIEKAFSPKEILGIDLSPQMVAKTKELGLNAKAIDISKLDNSFDVITAVFDMINYLDKNSLQSFCKSISQRLNSGGYFLCDINTLYGFEEVAVGSFSIDEDDMFLAIESDFEDNIYSSDFTLFEKQNECYIKSKERIKQYYHSKEEIVDIFKEYGMELVDESGVTLYLDEEDKRFLVFNKV